MSSHLKGTPAQGLWGATLGFFVGFAAVALFGPTAGRFREVMELSPVAVAFLVAMPALSGSLLQDPVRRLGGHDRGAEALPRTPGGVDRGDGGAGGGDHPASTRIG
jgi:hypothetical protein